MTNLIKITEKNGKQLVSARELYEYLEIKERFSVWFDRNIEYGFEAFQDYSAYVYLHPQNKQEIQDYSMILDMAKEISMISKTEKGKLARKYFIACEKQLKQQFTIPQTYSEALQLASTQAKQIELQSVKIETMTPKAEFYDTVTGSEDTIDMGRVAKVLNMGIGRTKLFMRLRELKILQNNNAPYQQFIDNGCFRIIESTYNKPDGSTHISLKTVVYQKGIAYIKKRLNK